MRFAARLARDKHPHNKVVFIGPCIAKRHEAVTSGEVDAVLTFEELGALLIGLGIDIMQEPRWKLERPADESARNYAKSCGVSQAVLQQLTRTHPSLAEFQLSAQTISGVDQRAVRMLRQYAAGKMPKNFLEVMCCEDGCRNGPCSLGK